MANITYKQLRDGTWGLAGHNLVTGTTVTVTKRSGETKREVVGSIVWKGTDGYCYATIATEKSASAPATKSAPKARSTSTRSTSTRRSSRKAGRKEGAQEGKYQSSREGDDGDEVGRVCWLKARGTRIPVVVVGFSTGYCEEDGLSFSLPMDEGYYTVTYYRDATEDEAAALTAKDTAAKEAKEAAALAAKTALEASEKAARAPLEGLTRSDSLLTPKGTRTLVAPRIRMLTTKRSVSARSKWLTDEWSTKRASTCTMTAESTSGLPKKSSPPSTKNNWSSTQSAWKPPKPSWRSTQAAVEPTFTATMSRELPNSS